MLQRVQSVLLLLTALALGVFLGTNSFVKAISPSEKVVVNPYHVFHQTGNLASFNKDIYYVAVLGGLALILTIFYYFSV
jgi:hypothetical protein